jgi:hypothetical protein
MVRTNHIIGVDISRRTSLWSQRQKGQQRSCSQVFFVAAWNSRVTLDLSCYGVCVCVCVVCSLCSLCCWCFGVTQGNATLTPAAALGVHFWFWRALFALSFCAKRQTAAANFAHLLINYAIIAVANVHQQCYYCWQSGKCFRCLWVMKLFSAQSCN